MDNIKDYQQIIIDFLEEISKRPYANMPNVEKQLIADTERHRYQLISFGWATEDKLVNATLIYIEIKDDKVWLQQNWTELEVASELVHRGIPKSKIVLGLVPAYGRRNTDYAVA